MRQKRVVVLAFGSMYAQAQRQECYVAGVRVRTSFARRECVGVYVVIS